MLRLHHLLLSALVLVFVLTYRDCLAILYRHEGMVPIEFNLDFWLIALVSMFAVLLVFPHRIERPSDLFLVFYLLTSVVWATVLWNGTGLVTSAEAPLFIAVMLAPVYAIIGLRRLLEQPAARLVYPIQLGSSRWLPVALTLLLALGAVVAYVTVGGGSLTWDDMYTRRLEGRDAFAGNVFASYLTGICTNGVLPMLGFVAGYRRSPSLVAAAFTYVILMFFLLGLKAPAINLTALTAIGFCFRILALRRNMVPVGLLAVLSVYTISLVLFYFQNDTFLADYLVRRISMVQPQVQSYYFDFWMHPERVAAGLAHAPVVFSDITYAIGFLYLHNPASNADTNAMMYALASGGVISYVLCICGVSFILSVVDAMARKTDRPEFFGLAALFSILVSEQAWTTVLATSGIALCLVLVMLFSYSSPGKAINAR